MSVLWFWTFKVDTLLCCHSKTRVMLTIKKKLAEQASSTASASSGGGKGESRGRAVKRRVSFRSQLLTEGRVDLPSQNVITSTHSSTDLNCTTIYVPSTILEVRELGEILPSKPRLNPVTLYIHVVCT